MKDKNQLIPAGLVRDPLSLLRQVTSAFDRVFDDWSAPFPVREFARKPTADALAWAPKIDLFERDNRLVTRVDLPGMKRQDVTVEMRDGHLVLSGERKREVEEKKDNVYRTEREYGSFYRLVPLPDGVKPEDVKATFADGVLEVSMPLPAQAASATRTIPIEEPAPAKTAA
jgi:HSP20 family protein